MRSLCLLGMDEQAAQDLLTDKGLNGTPESDVPWELWWRSMGNEALMKGPGGRLLLIIAIN